MQNVTLYKYTREDGGITVSPVKPEDTGYTTLSRLIADEGKELVKHPGSDGETRTICVDTDTPDEWIEEDTIEEYAIEETNEE